MTLSNEERRTQKYADASPDELRALLAAREKTITILLDRAERIIDSHGSAFDIFQTNVALEKTVAARTRELEELTCSLREARDIAERNAAARSEFLAKMSHEIRTPMNGIIAMAELLQTADLNEEEASYLDTIEVSAEILLGIINDILNMSKIEAGKLDIEARPFSLRETVEHIGRLCATSAQKKGLEFLVSLPNNLPMMVGDELRLRQVLVNLVSNAVKFTEKGEVSIQIEIEGQTEELISLAISVTDTGIGISESRLGAIFESFTQADNSTTRQFGGTGLGLTIAKHLVELMGGKIGVSSHPGLGSEFWVRIALPKDGHGEPLEETDVSLLEHIRVLVVDDNATNRKILASNLGGWKMQYELCSSGKAALEALLRPGSRPFDLILMDHQMPDMDGIETSRRIKQEHGTQTPTIVVLSSALDSESKATFAKCGVSCCLEKPIRKSDLVRVLLQVGTGARHHKERTVAESQQFNLKILLAEDNTINAIVAQAVLGRLDCECEVATNGIEAVKKFASGGFDLILMDVQMPEMGGLEATRNIRERELKIGGHIPIVAMTASAMEGDRDACLSAGMNYYISKPFKPAQIIEVLSVIVSAQGQSQ